MKNPWLAGATRPFPFATIGHRGAMGLAPENTLESFELAFDLGAQVVELDVHLTRDQKLVVIHDDTLDRTTGQRGVKVSSLALDDLRALDAGRWFADMVERQAFHPLRAPTADEAKQFLDAPRLALYRSGKVHPPSLDEVLALARHRDRFVNVELKAIPRFYPGLAGAAVACVRAAKMEERVVFSSFDHQTIASAKRLAPEIAGALLEISRLHDPGRYVAQNVGADGWIPSCMADCDSIGFGSVGFEEHGAKSLDKASVESAHRAGVFAWVWTENDPAKLKALAELGLDGVITDFPNRVASARLPS